MEMEASSPTAATHQFLASSTNIIDATQILIKGKRTKRHRPLSPSPSSAVNSSSASGDCASFSSTTTTNESTEEEQDMANCLILLAQGDTGSPHQIQGQADDNKTEQKGSSSRFCEMATVSATASSKMGLDIYECKTCKRTFSSFQALGGHRASHKKPKVSSPSASTDEKKPSSPQALALLQPDYDFEEAVAHIKTGFPHQISLQLPSNRSGFITSLNNKAAKLHECSICGSEFTSGQALGGHMRRHRASTRTSSDQAAAPMGPTQETTCHASTAVNLNVRVKPRNILPLDLNLPAPEDDLRESKFQFVPTQKAMVLSAPALVDCHY